VNCWTAGLVARPGLNRGDDRLRPVPYKPHCQAPPRKQNLPTVEHRQQISVCICTFKRPALLRRLLNALQAQVTEGLFDVHVIVVDNDSQASARDTVAGSAPTARMPVTYDIEPEQNIALARNRAVAHARGDFVAFIDDDEFPGPDWLLLLWRTLLSHQAQGALGPVKPHFDAPPPQWVVRGAFCERPSHATGTMLTEPRQTRTGNVLLRSQALTEEAGPFDARFGRTGGEDVDFFSRRLAKGDRFVWCHEAPVFESVPPERMTRGYFLRRALLRGVVNAEMVRPFSFSVLKSVFASVIYTALLPLLVWRQDLFMRYLMRDCDHLGKVFAVCGIKLVRQRAVS
jgi:succinoglycan biosynthesis protein ExoM